jgi:hypothetical protein
MKKSAVFVVSLGALLGCGQTQLPPTPQAASLKTEDAEIEIIGLREWTLEMVQDSLAKYAPEDGLATHACAAALRTKLGFADASVSVSLGQPGLRRVDIAVVEPADSAWVQYLPSAPDSFPDLDEWGQGFRVFLESSGDFQTALQLYALFDETPPDLDESILSAPGDELAEFLRSRTTDDLELALSTLERDRNWHNRTIAYAVLGRFPDDDRSWHALVDGLRDPNGPASGTASQTLGAITRTAARRVDWSEKEDALRWLVNGTNLFGHTPLLRALAATQIDPGLAPEILQDFGGITPYKLVSSNEGIRNATAAFLRQISGEDFGYDPDDWIAWIASVR